MELRLQIGRVVGQGGHRFGKVGEAGLCPTDAVFGVCGHILGTPEMSSDHRHIRVDGHTVTQQAVDPQRQLPLVAHQIALNLGLFFAAPFPDGSDQPRDARAPRPLFDQPTGLIDLGEDPLQQLLGDPALCYRIVPEHQVEFGVSACHRRPPVAALRETLSTLEEYL